MQARKVITIPPSVLGFFLAGLGFTVHARASAPDGSGELDEPKATLQVHKELSWKEMKKLLGAHPNNIPRGPTPVAGYSLQDVGVTGSVEASRANLVLHASAVIATAGWAVVPLLPASMSATKIEVRGPANSIAMVVRDEKNLSLVANTSGSYALEIEAEGRLITQGQKTYLRAFPQGVTGGRVSLEVAGELDVSGKTAWKTVRSGGATQVSAALGAEGLDLVLTRKRGTEARADSERKALTIENLEAITVVTLGGRGVARLRFRAAPGASEPLDVTLPRGARPWRILTDASALSIEETMKGQVLRIPLGRPSTIEVAYTFDAPRLGLRGRLEVELPRLSTVVRGARWSVWLPAGLEYSEIQSSFGSAAGECSPPEPEQGSTPIDVQGQCRAFSSPALEPSFSFVEGKYKQSLAR